MSQESPVKVGVVGTGNISSIYLKNSKWLTPIEITAVSDLNMEKAAVQAAAFDIPKACSVADLLADSEIDLILNLTIPDAHASVAMATLTAGKSVYNEKPLALTREEARAMLDLAKDQDLLVGCAPDTVMGAGLQTCRRLIDSGEIGTPVAATAFMMCSGTEF